MMAAMEKPIGEKCTEECQGALVLKLAQMRWFQVEILGNEGGSLSALCNDIDKGE